jgi:hypothetical protein
MNNTPSPFKTDLAAVLGCSATTGNIISPAISEAKQALGIDKHTKSLTDDDKAAIIQWHKSRLTDESQIDIETIAPAVALNEPLSECEPVETIPPAVVEPIATPELEKALQLINTPLSELELLKLENAKLQAKLEAIDHKAAPTYHINETVRIAFYIGDKRTVIALSGFYLNALMLATGINKKSIPAWIQSAVNEWTAFDEKLNVTEQVKLLIVRELESQLIKSRG